MECGYTYEQIGDLTVQQALTIVNNLPLIEYRRHYPAAMVLAAYLNSQGGKGDGSSTLPASKAFTVEELLPFYARPQMMMEPTSSINRHAAQEFLRASAALELPPWVISVAPVDLIRAASRRV